MAWVAGVESSQALLWHTESIGTVADCGFRGYEARMRRRLASMRRRRRRWRGAAAAGGTHMCELRTRSRRRRGVAEHKPGLYVEIQRLVRGCAKGFERCL